MFASSLALIEQITFLTVLVLVCASGLGAIVRCLVIWIAEAYSFGDESEQRRLGTIIGVLVAASILIIVIAGALGA